MCIAIRFKLCFNFLTKQENYNSFFLMMHIYHLLYEDSIQYIGKKNIYSDRDYIRRLMTSTVETISYALLEKITKRPNPPASKHQSCFF